ncbi:uncharacterized protein B0H18DRAFT_1010465 [Fomitopsis serialis]|uniref:uncharacterized protein n=1 Tax=Fomitopsis serialis TaxID=139415 RepID=UPI0020087BBD|nr:uncharacterized protein B0H18DRAFT_1010465 [Neoantrodia serialis]KAH9924851.1 hypothetical protein B0H18DRAFT_1010465 [Neoantrodia serialis]
MRLTTRIHRISVAWVQCHTCPQAVRTMILLIASVCRGARSQKVPGILGHCSTAASRHINPFCLVGTIGDCCPSDSTFPSCMSHLSKARAFEFRRVSLSPLMVDSADI